MSRQRRIYDRADVLTDAAAHWPFRPGWVCVDDGQPWPCEPLRRHLLATLSRQEIGLEMGGHYAFAVRELHDSSTDVYQRFFGWIRGD